MVAPFGASVQTILRTVNGIALNRGELGGVQRGSSGYHIHKIARHEVVQQGTLMGLVDPQHFFTHTHNRSL